MAGERILLVDDNAVNLKLTKALLALENYEVASASSAEEALAVIGGFRPHLILTDIRLTGMDGLELTRRLRAMKEWRFIPIIALTGMNASEDEREAFSAGCNAFLMKPIQSQVLRNLVRRHLSSEAKTLLEPIIDEEVMSQLRGEFLATGADRCRRLMAMLPVVAPKRSIAPLFDYRELRNALHDWAGAGGTFGLPRITEEAREGEALLRRPLEEITIPLRSVMENLLQLFRSTPTGAKPAPREVLPEIDVTDKRPMILVCDDDHLVLGVIKSTLEANGLLCRTADNGRLALAMARNDRPDAAILDVNMPTLDGIQVLDEFRRVESTRKLKVMLLTARYDAEQITRGVHHGADDYMAKPFDPAALVERIKALLAAP